MELNDFSDWLKTTYNFDCSENKLFEVSLKDAFEQFKNSSINGVSFLDYYQGQNLFSQFLLSYLSHLSGLLVLVPEIGRAHV